MGADVSEVCAVSIFTVEFYPVDEDSMFLQPTPCHNPQNISLKYIKKITIYFLNFFDKITNFDII